MIAGIPPQQAKVGLAGARLPKSPKLKAPGEEYVQRDLHSIFLIITSPYHAISSCSVIAVLLLNFGDLGNFGTAGNS